MTIVNHETRHGLPLRARLLISSLAGVIPLFILGLLLLLDRYQSRRDYILDANHQLATLGTAYMQEWVQGQERILHTLAQAGEISGTRVDQQGLIARQILTQTEWDNLFITDARGQEIVSGHRLVSISDRDYFQRIKASHQPTVSNSLISRSTHHRGIVIAYPILRHGQFLGIVGAFIRAETVESIFTEVPLKRTTCMQLWGNDRGLIASSILDPQNVGVIFRDPVLDRLLSRKSDAVIARSPVIDQQQLIGFAPVRGTPWTITVGSPLGEALNPVITSMLFFLGMTGIVVVFTLVWSFYSANIVARQVTTLVKSAQAIGAGLFDTRVVLPTGDELEALAHSLNEMATDLSVADRFKSDLLSMVSHELKTPLTAIRSTLEVLTSGMVTPDSPQYQEMLEIAERQTRRLQDLIENLLNVARAVAGGLTVSPTPVALAPIVDATVGLYREAVSGKGLVLTVNIPPELFVRADTPKIALVLNNLLENAVKCTTQGSIDIQAHAEGNQAIITVTDTGCGLTPEVRQNLFQLFYQPEPVMTRRHGGAGLGMAVIKAIVEAHSGHVIVESDGPEHGSTFGFTLPLAE